MRVGLESEYSWLKAVVFFQRLALGLEFAEGGEFFAAEDGEGVEDVGEFLAGEAVEVGDEGVEFGAGLAYGHQRINRA